MVKQKFLGNRFHREINVWLVDTYPLLLSLTRFSCDIECNDVSLSEVEVFFSFLFVLKFNFTSFPLCSQLYVLVQPQPCTADMLHCAN